MIQALGTVTEVRRRVAAARAAGQAVGLVPTMGCLHQGHLELARRARRECGLVVMSIFVNPTQFGPQEDLERYPRDLERDRRLAGEAGVDAIFAPAVEEVYPPGYATYVQVEGLDEVLCGKSRPGHFRGVATVVAKLFNIVQPDRAYFGQKDYQQVTILRRMVEDLNIPVEMVTVPTVREEDGLAMSSRNVYLDPAERRAALVLYRALLEAQGLFASGERDAAVLEEAMRRTLAGEPSCQTEYAEVRDARTLKNIQRISRPAVAAIAARVGKTRLIDNWLLEV